MRMDELTVKEMAEQEGVHERTVRRWIDKGAVQIRRTPGGGIRILERRTMPRESGHAMASQDTRGHLST